MTSPLTRVKRPTGSVGQVDTEGGSAAKVSGLLARRSWWWGVALVVLIFLPLVITGATFTTIAVYCLMYMGIATAWNSFSGFSGYVSLGHAVFFGVGAYTMALLSTHWNMSGGLSMFALLPLAGIVAAIIAIPYGYIALRTRRHTFVVITIAFFFIFQLLAFNLSFTGGSAGVVLPNGQFSASDYNNPFYYACLIVLVLTVAAVIGIRRSRFGLQLFAIRDDEDRARSLGVKVGRVKITSFMISAIPVAMMGAVWAFFIGQIYPQFAFNPALDVTIALMAFLGGFGTIVGPLLGALVLEALQRYLNLYLANADLYLVIYGLLFLGVISFLPEGILPSIGKRLRLRRLKRQEAEATPATSGAVTP